MKKKTKVLLSSLLAISMSASLATGATYALFTSTSQVNVAVTSGTVNVVATVNEDSLVTYSMGVKQADGAFENGGAATLVGNGLKLALMTPGDKAEFAIATTNNSNVNILYRVVMSATGELVDALTAKATVNGVEYALDGTEQASPWLAVVANKEIGDITVSVEFPNGENDHDNQFRDKSADITFAVEAVQGNAPANALEGSVYAASAEQLANALTKGYSTVLMDDVELTEALDIPEGVTATLDLNGNTFTGSILAPNANLTIENGKLVNADPAASAIEVNAGSLTLDGVEISSARHAVRIDGNVTAIINGGTYIAAAYAGTGTYHAVNVSGGANVTINGGTFVGPKGTVADSGAAVNAQAGSTVIINGGNFSGGKNHTLSGAGTLIVKGGTFDQDPTSYVAEGYHTIKNGDTWTVLPEGTEVAADTTALKDVIKGEADTVILSGGNYTMPCSLDGSGVNLQRKELTIVGTKDTVLDVSNVDARDQFVTGATLVFDGVTLNFGNNYYMGFANTQKLVYRNCKIIGLQFLYGEEVIFENCVIDSSANTKEPHAVWTYAAKVVNFTDCEFIYGDRAINCYKDQDIDGGKQVVIFTNCTFTTTDSNSVGAVEINSSAFSVGIEVNMEGCTAPANGPMAYVSPWDSTDGAKTTINIK